MKRVDISPKQCVSLKSIGNLVDELTEKIDQNRVNIWAQLWNRYLAAVR